MSKRFSWQMLDSVPVIGIMRNVPEDIMHQITEQFAAAGLTTLEVTMNTPWATSAIASLSNKYSDTLNIGAGTVLTLQDLDDALAAGAQFIVTPIVNEDVIKACVSQNIPVFPGAYTPTEIYKAWSLGANMVKVFPASKLGIDYVKEVLAPLNNIKLLPTGGINLNNCTDFLQAGAKALGLATSLFPKDLIENSDWPALRNLFEQYVAKIKQYTGKA
ncbi:bifunctional 4-hydroxy-2-oxoglutarate aldolase/2-dehydro-3-deoxy-phosphogluconate aldolase [Foetidibacter luteolus]|uniref:bifunctional 4-hydroxy-2-oxoglutarate aldolase/2-dehydro-3-deoxy-phosphogluconate aldolase n=1 Tax=Foetidibacter luteolus TaxID=2608880 RepID=UPI00129AE07D|nr:bifunctional 4-hydroxy-2-oxoglutarate aldolase/2-dehydro-3-deoxy-phosphogluconate aldolase [Foetidibacter luteolus]